MRKHFDYQKINPVEWLAKRHGFSCGHISFDPNVSHQYRVIRQSAHDGTLLFTHELIDRCLIDPVVNAGSCFKPDPPREGVKRIHYTVGWLKLLSVYGTVNLPIGRYPGMRQRAILPVRCEHFYDGSNDAITEK